MNFYEYTYAEIWVSIVKNWYDDYLWAKICINQKHGSWNFSSDRIGYNSLHLRKFYKNWIHWAQFSPNFEWSISELIQLYIMQLIDYLVVGRIQCIQIWGKKSYNGIHRLKNFKCLELKFRYKILFFHNTLIIK